MKIGFRCGACSCAQASAILKVPDFEYCTQAGQYGECSSCGSVTQTPMPTNEQLSSFYPSAYHSFLPASAISRHRQKMRIAQLQRSVGDHTFDKTVLDFGCGQGLFLNAAAESFPSGRFLGYEIGDQNEIEKRYGERVIIFRGDTDFFWDQVPKVDLVTMNHVIEHLPEPLETMKSIYSILAPGGRLEGQTPNANCYERRLFGTRWSGFHSPRHTVVFSKLGLEQLLSDAGFATVKVTSGFNPASWAVSLGSVLQDPNSPRGIKRTGFGWLGLVMAALAPSAIESRTSLSGIMNFNASKAA